MRNFIALFSLFVACQVQAAITFVGNDYLNATSATSITLTDGNFGAAQDDLMVVLCSARDDAQTAVWTDPTDWTEIDQNFVAAGVPDFVTYVGYKVRGATAGQALTFSHDGAASIIMCQGIAIRGINTSVPIDVTYATANHFIEGTTNVANITCKAITTVTNNAWVLLFYGTSQTISGAAGAPTGYTIMRDDLTSQTQNRGLFSARKEVTAAGTETPGAMTHTDTTNSADPYCYTIAVRVSGAGADTDALLLLRKN